MSLIIATILLVVMWWITLYWLFDFLSLRPRLPPSSILAVILVNFVNIPLSIGVASAYWDWISGVVV